MESKCAFPLSWPVGVARRAKREKALFKTGFAPARDGLLGELKTLGATDLILSTNVRLRGDGLPYSGEREPDDPGVAVYFALRKRPHAMTCDRWRTVAGNLQALRLTVEAMRGIARWGSTEMRDQAFAGFAQLEPAGFDWRSVFHVGQGEGVTLDTVKSIYRGMALRHHPDRPGGDPAAMTKINEAWEAAQKELVA